MTEQEIRADERQRCIRLLEAEIDRGEGLRNLCDKDGKLLYADDLMQVGFETLRYCIGLLEDSDKR